MAIPSLAMIPSGYKATKLYSVLPTDGVGDFTVSRPTGGAGTTGNATRTNSAGLLETVAPNVPRLDYSDGGCPVLLTEPQSKNEYLNSQAMVTQTVTTVADEYTVSFYGTGTIALSGTFTGSLVGTGVNDLVQLTFTATAGALVSTVTGSVNESQLEKLSYATSRIRTEGTTITRVEDVVSDAGDANTFNSQEGVLRVNFKTLSFLGDFRQLSINSSGTNRIYLQIRDSGRLEFRTTNTLGDYFSSIVVDTSLDYVDCVCVWGLDRFAVYINGVDKGVSNVGVVFPANELIELNLHRGGDSDVFTSKIKELMVYKSIAEAKEDLPYITI
jgi:outer membrane lipoprotein SlyB